MFAKVLPEGHEREGELGLIVKKTPCTITLRFAPEYVEITKREDPDRAGDIRARQAALNATNLRLQDRNTNF